MKAYRQYIGAGLTAIMGVALLVPLVPIAAGAATTTKQPGITSSTITIGQVDDLSAPLPGLFKGAQDGTQAYFNYINSTGGVYGRKLVLDTKDGAYNAATVVTGTQAIAQSDFAMVGGAALLDSAEQPIIDQTKLPTIMAPNDPGLDNDVNVWDPTPQGNQTANGPDLWAKHTFPSASKHVGILYPAVTSTNGKDSSENLYNNAMKSAGLKITYQRGLSSSEFTFESDVLRMKSAGVTMYFNQEMPGLDVSTLAKETALQGYHPVHIEGSPAYTNNMIQASGGTAAGMYLEQQIALYEGEDAKVVPEVALFDKWVTAVDPKVFSSIVPLPSVDGWASGMLLVQALKAAGPNPTRASLVTQLNKITSFDANGLLPPGENPAKNIASKCFLVARLLNGKWTRVSPTPKSGFICTGTLLSNPGWKPMNR